MAGTGFALTVAGSGNTTISNSGGTNVLMMGTSGALVKEGAGTLNIGGNGNFTGGTTLTSGGLRISSSNSLGTGALILNGGLFASANTGTRDFNHQMTIGGDVTFGETTNTAAALINWNTAALSLGGGTRTVTVNAATTLLGSLTNGSLTKAGSANLTLANSTSDFGTLTINGGSVIFSNAARITGLAGSGGLVLTNGTLTVSNTANTTYSGAISGTAALTKQGSGTLSLSTAGTVTGATTVSAGTLELQAQSAWGTATNKTIGTSGTLRIAGVDQTYTNLIFSGSAATLDVASGRKLTAERTSSANNAFTKTGAGTVELTGSGSYNLAASGQTFNFNEGVVILNRTGGNAAIGGDSATVNIGNGSSTVTVRYGSAGDAAQGGQILQNNNIAIANSGTLDLNGFNGRSTNVTMTGGLLTTGAGTLTFVTSTTPLTYSGTTHQATVSGNVDLGGVNRNISVANGAAAVDMVINAAIAGTGGGGLTKTGAGVLELAGSSANTYVGATVVTDGTLRLNKSSGNAIAAGGSITNSATLLIASSNQVGDSVAVTLSGGTIAKGSGTITETLGALNLTATSFVDFGSGTGNFTFASYNPSSFKLTFQNFNLGNSLTVTSGTFAASEFDFNGFGYSWDTVPSGGFTITAIPEPSTVLAALGLAGLLVAPRVRRWLKKA